MSVIDREFVPGHLYDFPLFVSSHPNVFREPVPDRRQDHLCRQVLIVPVSVHTGGGNEKTGAGLLPPKY